MVPAPRLKRTRPIVAMAFGLSAVLLPLTGCGMGPVTTGSTPGALISGVNGTVHGGQNPVTSSLVRLMAPGTTGYGSVPSVLATTTSDPVYGTFTLPTYKCPTPDQLVYIEASGGNSGGGTNPAIDEVALLGNCSTLSSGTTVFISELTTIAAAYALAPFATVTATTTGIGTSSTNLNGLNNAFGPANNLIAFSNGYANSSTSTMVLPTQLLNTLANILSACVNSTVLAERTACSTLFTDTIVAGIAPTNTFQAALNIALHPGANVSGTTGLYSLATTNPPFQPAITSATAPNDFTLAIGYTNTGINNSGGMEVAIDSKGDAWGSNYSATQNVTGLIEISPAGVFLNPANGFGSSVLKTSLGLGVDQNGLIWAADSYANRLAAFNPDGSVYGTYTGLIGPYNLAVDGKGDIWASDTGYKIESFQELVNNLPQPYALAATFPSATYFGAAICITPTTLYELASGSGTGADVTIVNLSTNVISGTIAPDNGSAGLGGCAVDHAGNLYLADYAFNGVEVYNSSGTLVTSFAIPTSTAVATQVQDMAIDGLGNSLVAVAASSPNGATSYAGGFLTFNSSGTLTSPAAGYYPTSGASNASGLNGFAGLTPLSISPTSGGVAVDGSGNLWLAGTNEYFNGVTGFTNYVTEVIGIAAPVVTPKATAVTNNTIAMRP